MDEEAIGQDLLHLHTRRRKEIEEAIDAEVAARVREESFTAEAYELVLAAAKSADEQERTRIRQEILAEHERASAALRHDVVKVRDLLETLSPEERNHPAVQEILVDIHRLTSETLNLTKVESRAGRRQYRVGLVLGALLGLPIGILGTWFAGLLGIG